MQKTNNYEMFIFRDDNRAEMNKAHINRLVESIRSKNLLEFKPILVNSKMEILDGQHRLKAAEMLGVDIYYNVTNEDRSEDLVLMNISKSWLAGDFFNFYIKHGYEEYIKLRDFMKKNTISLRIALNLCMRKEKNTYNAFKMGRFVFYGGDGQEKLEGCWKTIHLVKGHGGKVSYLESHKFWTALLHLVGHPDFNEGKWHKNLSLLINRLSVRATTDDYIKTLVDIYNWKNPNPLEI